MGIVITGPFLLLSILIILYQEDKTLFIQLGGQSRQLFRFYKREHERTQSKIVNYLSWRRSYPKVGLFLR